MNRRIGIGEAVGKVILMGEHSVVYGEPAISTPFFAARTRASVRESQGDVELHCDFYSGRLEDSQASLRGVRRIIEDIVGELGEELRNFDIYIETSLPIERGMGSSAAVAVAVTRALYDYFQRDLGLEELIDYADRSEKIVHGNPSGLDAATIIGERSLFYIKGEDFMPFDFKLEGYLVVADSGQTGNTKEAVEKVRELYERDHARTSSHIKRLGDLARESKVFLEKNNIVGLAKAMNEAQEILASLGVSNDRLDRLTRRAREEGALASKLTGGGLGGSMIALVEDRETGERIAASLVEEGARDTWISDLGVDTNGRKG